MQEQSTAPDLPFPRVVSVAQLATLTGFTEGDVRLLFEPWLVLGGVTDANLRHLLLAGIEVGAERVSAVEAQWMAAARFRRPRVSPEQRRRIFARDGGRCRYCRRHLTLELATVDHLTPRARGGGDEEDNLALCCRTCNSRKGDATLEEAEKRQLLPRQRSGR